LTLSSSSISAVISPFANASGVHNTKLTAVADDENTAKFTLSSLSPLTRVAPSARAFPRVGVSHTPRTAAGGFGGVRVVVFTTVVIGAFPRAIGGFASTFPLAPVVASLRVVVVVRARARAPVPNVPVPVPAPPPRASARRPARIAPRASRVASRDARRRRRRRRRRRHRARSRGAGARRREALSARKSDVRAARLVACVDRAVGNIAYHRAYCARIVRRTHAMGARDARA
jgi:hypothetical protein